MLLLTSRTVLVWTPDFRRESVLVQDSSGYARDSDRSRNIFRHGCTRADNDSRSDVNAWQHRRGGADKHIIGYVDIAGECGTWTHGYEVSNSAIVRHRGADAYVGMCADANIGRND